MVIEQYNKLTSVKCVNQDDVYHMVKCEALDYVQVYNREEVALRAARKLDAFLVSNPSILHNQDKICKRKITKHIQGAALLVEEYYLNTILRDANLAPYRLEDEEFCQDYLIKTTYTTKRFIWRHIDHNYVNEDFKGIRLDNPGHRDYISTPYTDEAWETLELYYNLPIKTINDVINNLISVRTESSYKKINEFKYVFTRKLKPTLSLTYTIIPILNLEELRNPLCNEVFRTPEGNAYMVTVETVMSLPEPQYIGNPEALIQFEWKYELPEFKSNVNTILVV